MIDEEHINHIARNVDTLVKARELIHTANDALTKLEMSIKNLRKQVKARVYEELRENGNRTIDISYRRPSEIQVREFSLPSDAWWLTIATDGGQFRHWSTVKAEDRITAYENIDRFVAEVDRVVAEAIKNVAV